MRPSAAAVRTLHRQSRRDDGRSLPDFNKSEPLTFKYLLRLCGETKGKGHDKSVILQGRERTAEAGSGER